jgi:hypothetical protein
MSQASDSSELAGNRKRTRSPAYPFINLETAITRARQFYDKEQRNGANINVASKHWGFLEGSSSGAQTVAALISFSLMQDEGVGEKRTVRLTQSALRILLDTRPESAEKAELIRQAALAPKIHRQLWENWGANFPSDAQLRHTLLFGWETPFNENAVDSFIAEYKSTVAFARLAEADKKETPVEQTDQTDRAQKTSYTPKIGDYVQWESQGILQLAEPGRVRELSPDGDFAFLDGSYTGIPIEQLIQEKAPMVSPLPANVPLPSADMVPQEGSKVQGPRVHMQEFVVPLSDGRRAVFQWPSLLTNEDVDDLKDSLKILERKVTRSAV